MTPTDSPVATPQSTEEEGRGGVATGDRPLRVLSLGAGVQSTAVLMMSLTGDLPPLDAAIFADTQAEPRSVYDHLGWLAIQCENAGLPLHVVTYGNLREDALDPNKRSGGIPVFIRNANGSQGKLHRECTSDYKAEPIERKLRELAGLPARYRHPEGAPAVVEQVFGISVDEWQRMRTPKKAWIVNRYPLVDARIDRAGCLRWMEEHGYPKPPRSACSFCPFHSDAEWRRLRDEEPDAWEDAVAFDAELRTRDRVLWRKMEGTAFLHRSMKPLADVDLSTVEEKGQGSLFDQECSGYCGA